MSGQVFYLFFLSFKFQIDLQLNNLRKFERDPHPLPSFLSPLWKPTCVFQVLPFLLDPATQLLFLWTVWISQWTPSIGVMGCVQSSEQAGDRSNLTRAVDPRLPFENYRQLYNLKNSWKAIARKLEDMAKSNLLRYSKFLATRRAIL